MSLFILISIALMIILLATNKFRASFLFFTFLNFYFFLDLISIEKMSQNFVNPALITLVLLILISKVLENTIFISIISNKIFSKNYKLSILKLTTFSAFLSAFLNNTAIVASMLSVIKNNAYFNPSKLLIPLSFSAIIGGTMTLIGTSTNLIVNGFIINSGFITLNIFDFLYVGLPITIVGIIFLVLFSNKLLPNNKIETKELTYFVEAKVLSGSNLIDKSVKDNGFRSMQNLFLVEIIRKETLISPVTPNEIIREDDILVFVGDIKNLSELTSFDKLKVFDEKNKILNSNILEVIISHESNLIGDSIKEANFRVKFDAGVVAVKRGKERLSGKIGGIKLQAGDKLALVVGKDFYKRDNLTKNFYFISEVDSTKKLPLKSSLFVVISFFSVILLSAFDFISLIKGLILILTIFIALEFVSLSTIRRSFPLDLILIVGSALGIAQVLIDTNSSNLIANFFNSHFGDSSEYIALIGVYILTLILTEIITNSGAIAIAFPIALSTALALEVNPMAFIMVSAYSASASFLSPFGYQTNLMIYSEGRYKIRDYFKIGLPFTIIYGIIVLTLVPIFFPFR